MISTLFTQLIPILLNLVSQCCGRWNPLVPTSYKRPIISVNQLNGQIESPSILVSCFIAVAIWIGTGANPYSDWDMRLQITPFSSVECCTSITTLRYLSIIKCSLDDRLLYSLANRLPIYSIRYDSIFYPAHVSRSRLLWLSPAANFYWSRKPPFTFVNGATRDLFLVVAPQRTWREGICTHSINQIRAIISYSLAFIQSVQCLVVVN